MMILPYIRRLLAGLSLLSCNSSGQFASHDDRSREKQPSTVYGDTNTGPETDQSDGQESEVCGEDATTKVRLLTPDVKSNDADNHLAYEISAVDCQGLPIPQLEGRIDFDIGAVTSVPKQGLAFRTLDTASPQEGIFDEVSGQDLFGNSGAKFKFFRTNVVIKLNLESQSVKIRIDLGGSAIAPYTPDDKRNGTVATYLRFGDAKPVKQSVKLNEK